MYHLSTASKTALRKEEIVRWTILKTDSLSTSPIGCTRLYDEVFGYIEDATKTLPGAAAPGELPGELPGPENKAAIKK